LKKENIAHINAEVISDNVLWKKENLEAIA
jgi:hypothetical protein